MLPEPLTYKDLLNSGMLLYYNKLDPKMDQALSKYTSSEYTTLNNLLRDGLNPNNAAHKETYPVEVEWIEKLDKVIKDSPTIDRSFVVYRGMVLKPSENNNLINNLAYTSTSLDIDTAMGFAGSYCCLYRILVNLDNILHYVYLQTGEKELLFQRHTHFVVMGKPKKYKYYYPSSNNYKLIDMYDVEIKPGIVIPTHYNETIRKKITGNKKKQTNDKETLKDFIRYVEVLDEDEMDILYGDDEDIPKSIVEDYIREHKHYYIDKSLEKIMLNTARKMIPTKITGMK
jgi:hypothetical protein